MSQWGGCASAYTEPVTKEEEQTAVRLVNQVQKFNPRFKIEFRLGLGDHDRLHHVFRWTREPIEQVFRDGFRARSARNQNDPLYFDLDYYVNRAGKPLDPGRNPSVFISTTALNNWQPAVDNKDTGVVYRYEIYAPGGIFVAETLGKAYRQAEVAFVDGIAPQYIRSAQRFRPDSRGRRQREGLELSINAKFRPSPDRLLPILYPVLNYIEREGGRKRAAALNRVVYTCNHPGQQEKKQVAPDTKSNALEWYTTLAANTNRWISAAFSSSYHNEVYIFTGNEYVLIDYAPGTTNDRVLYRHPSIHDGFPSLPGTFFAEWGIDCAFRSHHGNEAFIFCGNLCALIDFAPHSKNDKILKGPMAVALMFPFFKGTVFEKGIDAAFQSSFTDEAYLFRGNQYARINYNSRSAKLFYIQDIARGFHSLRGTIFESGIEAAFASHIHNEAYLFKGDSYARINFAPGTSDDYLIGAVKKIIPNWPSLQGILPWKCPGVDVD